MPSGPRRKRRHGAHLRRRWQKHWELRQLREARSYTALLGVKGSVLHILDKVPLGHCFN
jgi:hypothetical protein